MIPRDGRVDPIFWKVIAVGEMNDDEDREGNCSGLVEMEVVPAGDGGVGLMEEWRWCRGRW